MNIFRPFPPIAGVAGAVFFVLTFGCSDKQEATDSPELSDDSGSVDSSTGDPKDEPPDYEAAFPQDRVARLDIVISAEDWSAMVADMTDMLGAFGSGGGLGGMGDIMGMGDVAGMGVLPQELVEACAGQTAGAACEAALMGMALSGTCTDQAGSLTCIPAGGMGMLPTEFGDAGIGVGGGIGGGSLDLLPRTPLYVPCQVTTEDGTWSHVGIRFKGNSSLSSPWSSGTWKLPLRLKFDEFEDTYPEIQDQRFHGFKAMGLSNGALDASLLRDKVGNEVFAKVGMPAPATAFFRVFIDHGEGSQYFGLYTGIEIPSDDAFLDTHFAGHKGNLYKPDGAGATWATWDPESLGKENNEEAADFSDARALFDALHADRSDASQWRSGLEATFDVDGFLHWLALNTVIQDWDSYGRMSHNYYVYSDPNADNRLHWIPWDHSFAFSGSGGIGGASLSLGLSEVTDAWPLIRFLLDDAEYQATYTTYVARAAESEYTIEWATARFTEAHALIAPYVVGSEGERPGYTFIESTEAFEQTLDELVAHVHQRQSDVASYLND
jgi:spore coat protein H